MIHSVVVVGGGSAGLLAAISLRTKLPAIEVTVIRSTQLGVIGVGEATTPVLPTHLHGYLGIDPGEMIRETLPSFKLGIRFLWGPRSHFDYTFTFQADWRWQNLPKKNGFYCFEDFHDVDQLSALMSANRAFLPLENGDPLIKRMFGYHIENERFVAYLERVATSRGVRLVDDTVDDVRVGDQGVDSLRLGSGQTVSADLFIDCSGFRSLLLGKALAEPYENYATTLFCDRALAGSWERTDEPILPYTTAETMDAGWCWRIDHPDQIARGYVYSSAFITDEAAEREFRAKNPRAKLARVIKFSSGRYRRSWVQNVVGIGNAFGFVEPLESTALHALCHECRLLSDLLIESDRSPGPTLARTFNGLVTTMWDEIRWFLGVHFKFNTRLDTPFWRACRADVDIGPAQAVVDYYQENGPNTWGSETFLRPQNMFGMEGYLTMLLGMKVPHRNQYRPSAGELETWNAIIAENRRLASRGLTVEETYARITSPDWSWIPGYFAIDESPKYNR